MTATAAYEEVDAEESLEREQVGLSSSRWNRRVPPFDTRRRARLGLGTLALPPLVRSLPRRPLHVYAFGPRPGRWAQSTAVASAS
eukprot:scaffold93420_cov59-Phaeocystis_antarctica.AAC.2